MSLTIPQSLYIHSLVRRGKQNKAQQIDRMSRWAFPVFYAVMAIGNYVFYLYLTSVSDSLCLRHADSRQFSAR